MAVYHIWPSTDGPNTTNTDGVAYNMGNEFIVTAPAWVTELRFYRGQLNCMPTNARIYHITGATTGVSIAEVTPVFSGTGWQATPLPAPIALTPNDRYKVVFLFPDFYVSTSQYWSSGAGAGGITNGILFAPDPTTATNNEQSTFIQSATPAYPIAGFQGNNYWVDVTVTDQDPAAQSAAFMAFFQ